MNKLPALGHSMRWAPSTLLVAKLPAAAASRLLLPPQSCMHAVQLNILWRACATWRMHA